MLLIRVLFEFASQMHFKCSKLFLAPTNGNLCWGGEKVTHTNFEKGFISKTNDFDESMHDTKDRSE